MSKQIGIFIDVSNLYYCIGKKFGLDKKLDYTKYQAYIKDLGIIQQATAYGSQSEESAQKFILCLKHMGYNTKFQKLSNQRINWGCGITVDIVESISRFDLIIIGSSDPNLKSVIEWSQAKGVDVILLACGISKALKSVASRVIEIPESMLESPHELEIV